ncbi:hypothetical protein HAX54_038814 [Datura stramonium]|uniref:Uncharacterized protein n=1 Tax=Datura stramonium TaxID=4076 RepID=A0ABS8SIG8_DATST|nr:hypothetical protein [Datura stramonium]
MAREYHPGFGNVKFFTRKVAEMCQPMVHGVNGFRVFSKDKGKIIGVEEMGYWRPIFTKSYDIPIESLNLSKRNCCETFQEAVARLSRRSLKAACLTLVATYLLELLASYLLDCMSEEAVARLM